MLTSTKLDGTGTFGWQPWDVTGRKAVAMNKSRHDQNLQASQADLQQGDSVLVRNVGLKGKQKVADRWGTITTFKHTQKVVVSRC